MQIDYSEKLEGELMTQLTHLHDVHPPVFRYAK